MSLPSWIDGMPAVSAEEVAAAGTIAGPQAAGVRALIEALPRTMVLDGRDPESQTVSDLVDATDPNLARPSPAWIAEQCTDLAADMGWLAVAS